MSLGNQRLLFQPESIRASHLRSEHSQRGAQRNEQYVYGAQRAIQSVNNSRKGPYSLGNHSWPFDVVMGELDRSMIPDINPRLDCHRWLCCSI
jgi:hypothetical protein